MLKLGCHNNPWNKYKILRIFSREGCFFKLMIIYDVQILKMLFFSKCSFFRFDISLLRPLKVQVQNISWTEFSS